MSNPFDPLRGSALANLMSEVQRATEAHNRLVEAALGPTSTIQRIVEEANRHRDLMDRATLPAISLAQGVDAATGTLSVLYGADGVFSRLENQLGAAARIAEQMQRSYLEAATVGSHVLEAFNRNRELIEHVERLSRGWHNDIALGNTGLTSRLLSQALATQASLLEQSSAADYPDDDNSLLVTGVAVITEELGKTTTPEAVQAALKRLYAMFLDKLSRAKSALEAQALANIVAVLSLLINIYVVVDNQNSDADVVDAVAAANEAIISGMRSLQDEYQASLRDLLEDQNETLAVVVRHAVVRTEPHPKARPLERLSPGEVVSVVDQQQGWAHIMFYDAIQGAQVSGWVYGKFIHALPR